MLYPCRWVCRILLLDGCLLHNLHVLLHQLHCLEHYGHLVHWVERGLRPRFRWSGFRCWVALCTNIIILQKRVVFLAVIHLWVWLILSGSVFFSSVLGFWHSRNWRCQFWCSVFCGTRSLYFFRVGGPGYASSTPTNLVEVIQEF